jgi:hypothetical protein
MSPKRLSAPRFMAEGLRKLSPIGVHGRMVPKLSAIEFMAEWSRNFLHQEFMAEWSQKLSTMRFMAEWVPRTFYHRVHGRMDLRTFCTKSSWIARNFPAPKSSWQNECKTFCHSHGRMGPRNFLPVVHGRMV